MDSLLKDLPFAVAYLDDIIIFCPDSTTHGTHLEAAITNKTTAEKRVRVRVTTTTEGCKDSYRSVIT
ncbi:hypothetical protein T09_1862 [Trichinella sp. T9]|nr:hypothetical protein T09_1862 [Trichinella sp. T9]